MFIRPVAVNFKIYLYQITLGTLCKLEELIENSAHTHTHTYMCLYICFSSKIIKLHYALFLLQKLERTLLTISLFSVELLGLL